MSCLPMDAAPSPSQPPPELLRLAEQARRSRAEDMARFVPPDADGRDAAVLVLFGDGPDGLDVLLIERAAGLRNHAGQPAFPGGSVDPDDADAVAAALREAAEEVGLDPAGVTVLAQLPDLFIPVTGFVVTPVLAWWHTPNEVRPVDRTEVAQVERVPIAELAAPANRVRVRHPSGPVGPGFRVAGLLVWGFTAGLLDALLRFGGWEQPWQPGELVDLPPVPVRPGPTAPEDPDEQKQAQSTAEGAL